MKRIILIIAAAMLIGSSAYAAEEAAVREIPKNASREAIHAAIGSPDSEVLGYKETYYLSNGNTAVLQYSYFDDTLSKGYILVN